MATSADPQPRAGDRPISYWWIVLLAAAVGFAFQGSRGLSSSTEGRYAESAREMLLSGNYLEPTLSCKPHWTKPPLTYAVMAVSMRVFGQNAWGARIPNALAFVGTALAVAAIGAALWDRRTGFYAGVVYASAPFAISSAYSVSTDTLLTLFETLAMLAYLRAWRATQDERPQKSQRNVIVMYAWFGLAFLTKGPPSLLPLLAIIPWHLRQPHRPRLLSPVGLLAGFIVGGWWFALVISRHPELLRYFVGEEIVARVATDDMHRNPEWWKPFLYFIPPLALGTMPWTLLFFVFAAHARLWHPGHLLQRVRAGSPDGLLLLWLFLPLTVFFLSKSRLVLYVLPLCAPVSLAVAYICAKRLRVRTLVLLACAMQCIHITNKAIYARQTLEPNDRLMADLIAPFVTDNSTAYLHSESRHGVEFYLRRCMSRFSVHEELPESADVHLSEVLAAVHTQTEPLPLVLVAPHDRSADIERTLDVAGVHYRTAHNQYHVLWKVLEVNRAPEVVP